MWRRISIGMMSMLGLGCSLVAMRVRCKMGMGGGAGETIGSRSSRRTSGTLFPAFVKPKARADRFDNASYDAPSEAFLEIERPRRAARRDHPSSLTVLADVSSGWAARRSVACSSSRRHATQASHARRPFTSPTERTIAITEGRETRDRRRGSSVPTCGATLSRTFPLAPGGKQAVDGTRRDGPSR
jgi:hypothetical protein